MKRIIYDWMESKTVYEVFKNIYTIESISLTDLSATLTKGKAVISEQIDILKKQGLINDVFKNREKIYSINKKELFKRLNTNDETAITFSINWSMNFKELFEKSPQLAKDRQKAFHSGDVGAKAMAGIMPTLASRFTNEKRKALKMKILQEENKRLKAQLKALKH